MRTGYTRFAAVLLCAGLLSAEAAQAQRNCTARDTVYWDSVKACTDAGDVEFYLTKFEKNGCYVEAARACLERLRGSTSGAGGKAGTPSAIEELLAVCALHIAQHRLTAGIGGNAVDCYREVLSKDRGNRKALAGLQKVFNIYAGWARDALNQSDLSTARSHLEKLEALNPESPAVAELRAAVGAAAERQRLERRFPIGKTFREENCPECPEMVVVPTGSLTMGSPPGETGRYGDEGPQRQVRIRYRFAVAKYEVTFEEWAACVSAGHCIFLPNDRGWGRGRRPVINVSWHDAKQYVRWLRLRTGMHYRLLSEAEWEYAARAGTQSRYHWGDSIGRNQANCDGCGSRWDGGKTAPVGSFRPNRFGLYDMHGNVWEWVEDCWQEDYHGAPGDGQARTKNGDCSKRVLRGGSVLDTPGKIRAAVRGTLIIHTRTFGSGFRVARTLITP